MGKSNKKVNTQKTNIQSDTSVSKREQRQAAQRSRTALETRANTFATLAETLVITMLAIFPLYLNSQRYIELVKHKVTFFWIAMGLCAMAFVVVWLAFLGLAKNTSVTPWYKNVRISDWAALSYFLCILLSGIFSPLSEADLEMSPFWFFLKGNVYGLRYEGALTLTFYLLCYFLTSKFFVPRRRVWVLFAISANMLALIGFFQFIGNDFLSLFPYETHGYDYPYASLDIIFRTTLGNVDIISAYVGLVIPFFTVMYCKCKDSVRFLYMSAAITNFVLMILGGADGGKVGVMAGITAVVVFIITDRTALARLAFVLGLSCLACMTVPAALAAGEMYNATGQAYTFVWDGALSGIWFRAGLGLLALASALSLPIPLNPQKQKLAGIITAAVIVVVGAVGLEIVGSRIEDDWNVIHQAREVMHGRMGDHFGSYRGIVWKRTIPVIAQNPLLGTGPDSFYFAFGPYQEEAYALTNTNFDKAHNELLEVAVCYGLLGLAAFLTLLGSVAVPALRKVYHSDWLMAACVAAFGFFIQSLFGVSVPIVTPMFFVMLGIMVSLTDKTELQN